MYVEYIHTTSDRMVCSKDLVKRAIEFRKPERVPYNFDSNRTPVIAERYGDDFEWVFSTPPDDTYPIALGNDRYLNEFGVVYHRPGATFGEAKEFPLTDLSLAPSYRIPDFSHPARFAAMEEIVRNNSDKYILGMFPHFLFQQMLDLFGVDLLMVALLQERNVVDLIADRLTESCLRMVDCFAGLLCFFCPVDIQTTLPVGSPEEIVAKAGHLMKAFGRYPLVF